MHNMRKRRLAYLGYIMMKEALEILIYTVYLDGKRKITQNILARFGE